jgi:hypothetical protein
MVVHFCNLTLWKLRQEDCEFKASLGYIVRYYLKQTNKSCLSLFSGKFIKKINSFLTVLEAGEAISRCQQFERAFLLYHDAII